MECPSESRMEVLVDYAAERLNEDAAAAVEAHVSACAECRRFVDAQRSVWQSLDQWEPAEVSPDFDRKLWARIQHQERRPSFSLLRPWTLPHFRPTFAAAVIVLLLTAAVLLRKPRPAPMAQHVPPQTAAQTETLEADRIEKALEDIDMLRQLSLPAEQPQAM